jgi:arylsulfatase A-like enzyme
MPALLYLHYMEPHEPYEPPEPFRSKFQRNPQGAFDSVAVNEKMRKWQRVTIREVGFLSSLYSAEVASLDDELHQMMELLEQHGFLSNTIIVITADHGEEFYEHQLMGHGKTLYEDAVRIPLIVVAPGYPAGRVVQEDVSLIDVAPTLLELAGLPPEPRFEGRSLVPLLSSPWQSAARAGPFSAEDAPPAVSFELPSLGSRYDLRRHTDGIVRQTAKVLITPEGDTVGYDLAADPHERAPNPASLDGTKTALLDELLRATRERAARANPEAQHMPLDDATKEKLRALGYSVH